MLLIEPLYGIESGDEQVSNFFSSTQVNNLQRELVKVIF